MKLPLIALAALVLQAPAFPDTCGAPEGASEMDEDLKAVPCKDLRAGKDGQKRYFLIGPDAYAEAPQEGWPLLVILPGGLGNAEFNPFCRLIYKRILGERFVVAQMVSARWTPDQVVTWPTAKVPTPKMKFTTEDFFRAVVDEVRQGRKIDPRRIYTLSWSSGGPAAYVLSVMDKTPVTGSFIAMSVFWPETLGTLDGAKGKAYYLYHSPEDRTCRYEGAERALAALKGKGAEITLTSYKGGHGWFGNTVQAIRDGIGWLEERTKRRD